MIDVSVSNTAVKNPNASGRKLINRKIAGFKLNPLAILIAGVGLSLSQMSFAAEPAPTSSSTNQTENNTTSNKSAAAKVDGAQKDETKKNQPKKSITLSTITVRSRNRVEKLQDVPLSVSVVSGQELERLNATDISAVTQRLSNITWNQGNQRTSSLSIRGIGKQGQTEAQDPPVGLIVDGVNYAYNALASSFDFVDIDTVEVARGPQGTLLGKNASIGVINVTTKRPTFKPDASYSVTLGQWDTVLGRFAAGGPVIDDLLAWRGNLSVSKGKGDVTNAYNTDQTYTNKDRVSGKVQFLITPSETLSTRLEADIQPRAGETTNGRTINTPTPTKYADGKDNPLTADNAKRLSRRWFTQDPAYSVNNNYYYGAGGLNVNNDSARPLITGSNGATADINWRLEDYTLTSITAYKDYHFNAVNDEGTPFDVNRNSGGFFNDYSQRSQEFRLSSKVGGFVDYQTGLFFLDVKNYSLYQRVWGNDAGAWFASPAQYTALDIDGAGRYLMQNSLAGLSMAWNSPAGLQEIRNKSEAIFGQANWHFTPKLTLTTGLRITQEDRRNTASTYIRNPGNAAELNPDVVKGLNGELTNLGGFTSTAKGELGKLENGIVVDNNTPAQLALADLLAQKYFAKTPTNVPGAAYRSLSGPQQVQVANAKALRQGQIGVVFDSREAEPFKKTQPSFVLSPSYKISEDVTVYGSLQHGEKAGIAQATNGQSNLVKEEKTDAVELGIKTNLLENTLVFNAALFRMDISDYQQTSSVVDAYTTAVRDDKNTYYTNATANIPEVRSQGLEIDTLYTGIRNLSLRFAGAYTDAYYVEFPTSPQPVENGNQEAKFRDISGETLPGSSKITFNIGIDYHIPIWNNLDLHTSTNILYASKFNADNTLSSYGEIPAATTADFAIGLANAKQTFDVNLVVKNVLNDDTHRTQTWNTYTPAVSRWAGVTFSGKF
ncbi:MAG TPA: TonB-dependent receptor [Cellvibrionaceae bacterium]